MFKSNRLYINIAVVLALFFLPWWVPLLIGIVAMWWYTYYELIGIGFMLDMLYGSAPLWGLRSASLPPYIHLHPGLFFMWLTFVMFIAFQVAKKRVRFDA